MQPGFLFWFFFNDSPFNHYTLSRMEKPRTLTTPSAGKDVEQQKLSFIASENAKWYNLFGRQFGSFLQN